MNNAQKIFGWVLLIAGIILIAWTLIYSYDVFTGKKEVPGIFAAQANSSLSGGAGGVQGTDIQTQLQKALQEQLKGMISADTLPKILNLTVYSMLAFILIFGGTQLSGIGVKLLNK